MSALSIVLCSVVGFLVYVQIGRWLGWWSYRTLQEHLRYERTCWGYDRDLGSHQPVSMFVPLKGNPNVSMRLLFPIQSREWDEECSEIVGEAFCTEFLQPNNSRSLSWYRWLMMAFWPVKVVWCLGAWLVIGAIVATRLAIRFLKWSYRLLFTWPERKAAETEPQDTKKTVSQEHTVN